MAHPRGGPGSDAVRLDFDRRLMLQFRGFPGDLRCGRGVDHNTGEVGRLHRVRPGRHRQALLKQRLELVCPHRWRQRVSDDRSNTNACWKNSSPQKYWKYGFSHGASSERS
jgi:hypothetical protein